MNTATGEISVQNPRAGELIRMGDKLYLRIDGKVAVMEATFPMMTLCRCKLLPAYKNQLGKVQKGMTAYKYVAGIEKEDAAGIAGKAGEVKKFGDIEMVLIPAGSFLIGSPGSEGGRIDPEGPQYKVTISAFCELYPFLYSMS